MWIQPGRIATLITLGAVTVSFASGQTRNATREEILRLLEETRIRTDQDARVKDRDFESNRVASIKEAVRKAVLQLLRSGKGSEEALSRLLRELVPNEYGDAQPTAIRARLDSGEVVLVAYSLHTGPLGLPNVTAVVDGYRTSGAAFEFASELRSPLDGCEVTLQRIVSERANEVWALIHGRIVARMQHAERVRLIGFDGYRFHELWASETEMPDAQFVVERGSVKIHYLATREEAASGISRGGTVVRVHLSPAGAIAEKPAPDPDGVNLRKLRGQGAKK